MLKDITMGQYLPGDSVIHRLDARVKLVLAIAFIVFLFFVNSFAGYAVVTVYLAVVIALGHIPLRFLLRGIKPLIFLIALTFVINVLFGGEGTTLFRWAFIHVTVEGLLQAVFLALRLIYLIMGTSVLTLTTSPINLTDGLERLMSPLARIGFPAHELAMMMSITLRFIPTLLEETDKIMKAQMARGADFESGNVLQRAKALVPLLVPLFVSAFRRADELAMAMEARCYHGGEGRTRMKVYKVEKADCIAMGVTALFVAAILFLRYGV
ncbi:energy-coupling factor transporter transmembrane component T family protein [Gehongia tenuis]|uniref:Energy-coupling factor transporter transmembrane protein EcfT n=1 Tax=Gehongia tenuis TaxID=2763655 RepID=A0A926D511_9FIRM|nr:energy-coupling factor transporter transmembrane component T [Gehongia tenuis]MBC8531577.1 energy-coupling factor transporter transmembrane protein EcfT [Gehongia tenuis]